MSTVPGPWPGFWDDSNLGGYDTWGEASAGGLFTDGFVYNPPVSSVVPSNTINDNQGTVEEITKTGLGENKPIPIVYGRAQVGGQIFVIDYDESTGTWLVGYFFCLGEIESYVQVYIDGEAPVAGVNIDYYTGTTTQTANTKLSTAIASYTDDLVITSPKYGDIGIAYIVVEYTSQHYSSFPNVVAEIEGKKVWDPNTSTVVYSENPCLHLADLLSSNFYGSGLTVDDTQLQVARLYADDTTPTEVRRKSYTVINRVAPVKDYVEVLRAYASCYIAYRGNTAYLIPDKPTTSSLTLTADDIVAGSMKINKKDQKDLPTVIRCYYTDTTEDLWQERLCDPAKLSGVDAGTVEWLESNIRLNGIDRHSQAYRECVERLNKLWLADLEVEFLTFSEGLKVEPGDVITVSHPYGLTNEELRVIAPPEQTEPGIWRVKCTEYSASAYNDTVVDPTGGVLSKGSPATTTVPGTPTITSISETAYQLRNGEYSARLEIAWTAPTVTAKQLLKVTGYDIRVYDGATLVWQGTSTDTEASTAPLKEQVTYTVEVRAYNEVQIGTADSDTYFLVGQDPTSGSIYAAQQDATTALANAATAIQDASDALSAAQLAQATADDKIETFFQAGDPSIGQGWGVDETGNLWVDTDSTPANLMRRWNGSGWDSVQDGYIADVEALADTKITTWYQTGAPTDETEGNLWVDTSGGANVWRRYNAGSDLWVALFDEQDVADAQATADGKNTIYYSATEPSSGMDSGDFWVNTSATPYLTYVYDGVDWDTKVIGAIGGNDNVDVEGGEVINVPPDGRNRLPELFRGGWEFKDPQFPSSEAGTHQYYLHNATDGPQGGYYGEYGLRWYANGPTNAILSLAFSTSDVNTAIDGNSTWLFRCKCWVVSVTGGTFGLAARISIPGGGVPGKGSPSVTVTSNADTTSTTGSWVDLECTIDASSYAQDFAILQLIGEDNNGPSTPFFTVWLDGLVLERKVGDNTSAAPYTGTPGSSVSAMYGDRIVAGPLGRYAGIEDHGGHPQTLLWGGESQQAYDGASRTFNNTYEYPPDILIEPNGATYITSIGSGTYGIACYARNVSTTGFTFFHKMRPQATSLTTRTGNNEASGGTNIRDMDKPASAAAWDDLYFFTFSGTVYNNQRADGSYVPGTALIGISVAASSGVWTLCGVVRVWGQAGSASTSYTGKKGIYYQTLGQHAGKEFRVSLLESSHPSTTLTSLDQVYYTEGTVGTSYACSYSGTNGLPVPYWRVLGYG